jgi:hypothetical protein
MWEYRLIWTASYPSWWETAWKRGEALLDRHGRKPEERTDTYFVIPGRTDVGLKLRGDAEEGVEVKVLHRTDGFWQLWEKVVFFQWNDLEATRLAAMLKRDASSNNVERSMQPAEGARKMLQAAALDPRLVRVRKTRMQGRAGELLPQFARRLLPRFWVAELVEITVARSEVQARSVCVETMSPMTARGEPFPGHDAACSSYPDFLLRLDNERTVPYQAPGTH